MGDWRQRLAAMLPSSEAVRVCSAPTPPQGENLHGSSVELSNKKYSHPYFIQDRSTGAHMLIYSNALSVSPSSLTLDCGSRPTRTRGGGGQANRARVQTQNPSPFSVQHCVTLRENAHGPRSEKPPTAVRRAQAAG